MTNGRDLEFDDCIPFREVRLTSQNWSVPSVIRKLIYGKTPILEILKF